MKVVPFFTEPIHPILGLPVFLLPYIFIALCILATYYITHCVENAVETEPSSFTTPNVWESRTGISSKITSAAVLLLL